MKGLDGRTALITGAAGGIGSAAAELLASYGVDLALTDVSMESLEPVIESARAHGVSASAFALDATRPRDIPAVVERAAAALGPISLGVTCAGVVHVAPALDLDEATWDRTLDINLKGTFFSLQALARHMRDNQVNGRLVAISSIGGRSGRPDVVDYAASKAGVISVVKSLALALAPTMRVNAVCPGVVDTPMTSALHDERAITTQRPADESIAAMVSKIPLGVAASPHEIADAIAFLLSDAASHVTGQSLNVCGGLEFD